MTSGSANSQPRTGSEQQRDRILEVFSSRAKREGIRGVGMAALAAELRMSASTLYKHFPSKEALTLACVERWALELAATETAEAAPSASRDPLERFMLWLDAWADANATLSPAFARDLRSDYPAAWERFRQVVQERKRRGAELLRPELRTDLDDRVAFAILEMILDAVLRPEFSDRLRISRHDAIRSAVRIWAAGAVDRQGELRELPKR
ncbi:MAG: TetR/AcrR family transcriptional regulator [Myxococcales bacterium]|jgi:AcrR family transcriptional regulator